MSTTRLLNTRNILTTTGQSTQYPMTQKAVTDALNTKVGLTGNQTIAGVKTFSSTIGGSINGNAATVTNGVYTTGNQTIAGTKTFSSFPVTPSAAPTANYQAANKKYVDDTAIGVGQTWQNVTSNRTAGTTYTNSTGRPILVCVSDDLNIDRWFEVRTSSSEAWVRVGSYSGYGKSGHWSVIVPNGHQYRVTPSGAIMLWSELR